jgi:hypothetical protein
LEPVQVIVVASGTERSTYQPLRQAYPSANWQFHSKMLDSATALAAGLRKAHCDWVYLLDGDSVMERTALSLLAPLREERTFAVGSNGWSTLQIDRGLAKVRYCDPPPALFQTRLLKWFLEPSVYDPLSWDYVEWCWRARKVGYRCVVCPPSSGYRHLAERDGISEAEVMLRNRLLFQLRNFTTAGSIDRVAEEIARAPEALNRFFLQRETLWRIARGRLWNHRAPFTDEAVLAEWAPAAAGAD